MGELSQRMMVSGGNVSGLATQLVAEGLVERNAVPGNRRTFIVKLTPKGTRLFEKMAREHEEWVIGMLGHLSVEDVNTLMTLLRKVKKGL